MKPVARTEIIEQHFLPIMIVVVARSVCQCVCGCADFPVLVCCKPNRNQFLTSRAHHKCPRHFWLLLLSLLT